MLSSCDYSSLCFSTKSAWTSPGEISVLKYSVESMDKTPDGAYLAKLGSSLKWDCASIRTWFQSYSYVYEVCCYEVWLLSSLINCFTFLYRLRSWHSTAIFSSGSKISNTSTKFWRPSLDSWLVFCKLITSCVIFFKFLESEHTAAADLLLMQSNYGCFTPQTVAPSV